MSVVFGPQTTTKKVL